MSSGLAMGLSTETRGDGDRGRLHCADRMGQQWATIVSIFAQIGAGYLLRKISRVDVLSGKGISALILNFALPGLLLTKLIKEGTFTLNLIAFPFAAFFYNVGLLLLGWWLFKIMQRRWPHIWTEDMKPTFLMCLSGQNLGLFAFPLIEALYNEEAVFAIAMFDIGNAMYIFGVVYVLAYHYRRNGAAAAPQVTSASPPAPVALAVLPGRRNQYTELRDAPLAVGEATIDLAKPAALERSPSPLPSPYQRQAAAEEGSLSLPTPPPVATTSSVASPPPPTSPASPPPSAPLPNTAPLGTTAPVLTPAVPTWKRRVKKVLSMVPFPLTSYFIVIALNLSGVHSYPEPFQTFFSQIAGANGPLVLVLMGLYLEFRPRIPERYKWLILFEVLFRYIPGLIMGLLLALFLRFAVGYENMLAVCLGSCLIFPVPVAVVAFSNEFGLDPQMPGLLSNITMMISSDLPLPPEATPLVLMAFDVAPIATLFILIALGFVLKTVGRLDDSAGKPVASLLVNLTLPGILMVKMIKTTFDMKLIAFPFIAFTFNCLQLGGGLVLFPILRRKWPGTWNDDLKPPFLLCLTCHNIGVFAYPIFEALYGDTSVYCMAMWDLGNSVYMFGVAYAVSYHYRVTGRDPPKTTTEHLQSSGPKPGGDVELGVIVTQTPSEAGVMPGEQQAMSDSPRGTVDHPGEAAAPPELVEGPVPIGQAGDVVLPAPPQAEPASTAAPKTAQPPTGGVPLSDSSVLLPTVAVPTPPPTPTPASVGGSPPVPSASATGSAIAPVAAAPVPPRWRRVGKKIGSMVPTPLVIYVIVISLNAAGVRAYPEPLASVFGYLANCNTPLGLLLLGVYLDFHPKMPPRYRWLILAELLYRYLWGFLCGIGLAALLRFGLGFDSITAISLGSCVILPLPVTNIAFCLEFGLDSKLPGIVCNLTVLCSLGAIFVIALALGQHNKCRLRYPCGGQIHGLRQRQNYGRCSGQLFLGNSRFHLRHSVEQHHTIRSLVGMPDRLRKTQLLFSICHDTQYTSFTPGQWTRITYTAFHQGSTVQGVIYEVHSGRAAFGETGFLYGVYASPWFTTSLPAGAYSSGSTEPWKFFGPLDWGNPFTTVLHPVSQGTGAWMATWTPYVAGGWEMSILYGDHHVGTADPIVTVTPGPIAATWSSFVAPAIGLTALPLTVVRVTGRDQWKNPVHCTPALLGQFTLRWDSGVMPTAVTWSCATDEDPAPFLGVLTPTQAMAGTHTVVPDVGGNQVGSPATVLIMAIAHTTSNFTAPNTTRAGQPWLVTIAARDILGAAVGCDAILRAAAFVVQWDGMSPANVTWSCSPEALFVATIIPTEAGMHGVSVTTVVGGAALGGGPSSVRVLPGPASTSACSLLLSNATAGTAHAILMAARDAFQNPISCDETDNTLTTFEVLVGGQPPLNLTWACLAGGWRTLDRLELTVAAPIAPPPQATLYAWVYLASNDTAALLEITWHGATDQRATWGDVDEPKWRGWTPPRGRWHRVTVPATNSPQAVTGLTLRGGRAAYGPAGYLDPDTGVEVPWPGLTNTSFVTGVEVLAGGDLLDPLRAGGSDEGETASLFMAEWLPTKAQIVAVEVADGTGAQLGGNESPRLIMVEPGPATVATSLFSHPTTVSAGSSYLMSFAARDELNNSISCPYIADPGRSFSVRRDGSAPAGLGWSCVTTSAGMDVAANSTEDVFQAECQAPTATGHSLMRVFFPDGTVAAWSVTVLPGPISAAETFFNLTAGTEQAPTISAGTAIGLLLTARDVYGNLVPCNSTTGISSSSECFTLLWDGVPIAATSGGVSASVGVANLTWTCADDGRLVTAQWTPLVAGSSAVTVQYKDAGMVDNGTVRTVFVGPSTVSGLHSEFSLPAITAAGRLTPITVTARDRFDNLLADCGDAAFAVHWAGQPTDTTATAPVAWQCSPANGTWVGWVRPVVAGSGEVRVLVDGGAVPADPVGPGHRSVLVLPGRISARNSTFSSPPTATAGISHELVLTARDSFGNLVPCQSAQLAVSCPFGLLWDGHPVADVTWSCRESGQAGATSVFVAAWRPILAGPHLVAPVGGESDETVGIPATVTVAPGPISASRSTMVVPGATAAGQPSTFTIAARDAWDNVIPCSATALLAPSAPFSSALVWDGVPATVSNVTWACTATATANNGSLLFEGRFVLNRSGTHRLAAWAGGGDLVAGSPCNVTVSPAGGMVVGGGDADLTVARVLWGPYSWHWMGDSWLMALAIFLARLVPLSCATTAAGAISAPQCTLDATGTAVAGQPYLFTVAARDAWANRVSCTNNTALGAFEVHWDGELPAAAAAATTTTTTGSAVDPAGGEGQPVGGSPTVVVVSPGPISPLRSFFSSLPALAVAGAPLNLSVVARDAFNNCIPCLPASGPAPFAVSWDAAATQGGETWACDEAGLFVATWWPTVAGQHQAAVQMGAEGLWVGNQTTSNVTVIPGLPSSLTSSVHCPTITTAGTSFAVILTAQDAFHNPIPCTEAARSAIFRLSWDGAAPAVEWQCAGVGLVQFRALFAPTLAGSHRLEGRLANDDPVGQCNVTVLRGAIVAEASAFSAAPTTTAGAAYSVLIAARDSYGNWVACANDSVAGSLFALAPSLHAATPPLLGQGDMEPAWRCADGDFLCTLHPTHAGVYWLAPVVAGSAGVVGGHGANVTVRSGSAWGPTSSFVAAPSTIAGLQYSVTLSARDAYSNRIPCVPTLNDVLFGLLWDGNVPSEVVWRCAGLDWVGTFAPVVAGVHRLEARLVEVEADKSVAGGISVTVFSAALSAHTTTFAAPAQATACGDLYSVRIVPRDRFGNSVTCANSSGLVLLWDGAALPPEDGRPGWVCTETEDEGTLLLVQWAPRHAGSHTLELGLDSEAAAGGPAVVRLEPVEDRSDLTSVCFTPQTTIGLAFPVTLTARDACSNLIPCATGSTSLFTILWNETAIEPADLTWRCEGPNHVATFTPRMAGTVLLDPVLSTDGAPVRGAPLDVLVLADLVPPTVTEVRFQSSNRRDPARARLDDVLSVFFTTSEPTRVWRANITIGARPVTELIGLDGGAGFQWVARWGPLGPQECAQEGSVGFVVAGLVDWAGNEMVGEVRNAATSRITIDCTPPKIMSAASVSSSLIDPRLVQPGDTVSLSFATSEPIDHTSVGLSIAAHPVNVTAGARGNQFEEGLLMFHGEYVMQAGDPVGAMTWLLSRLVDLAGNAIPDPIEVSLAFFGSACLEDSHCGGHGATCARNGSSAPAVVFHCACPQGSSGPHCEVTVPTPSPTTHEPQTHYCWTDEDCRADGDPEATCVAAIDGTWSCRCSAPNMQLVSGATCRKAASKSLWPLYMVAPLGCLLSVFVAVLLVWLRRRKRRDEPFKGSLAIVSPSAIVLPAAIHPDCGGGQGKVQQKQPRSTPPLELPFWPSPRRQRLQRSALLLGPAPLGRPRRPRLAATSATWAVPVPTPPVADSVASKGDDAPLSPAEAHDEGGVLGPPCFVTPTVGLDAERDLPPKGDHPAPDELLAISARASHRPHPEPLDNEWSEQPRVRTSLLHERPTRQGRALHPRLLAAMEPFTGEGGTAVGGGVSGALGKSRRPRLPTYRPRVEPKEEAVPTSPPQNAAAEMPLL
ncbi:hypothetical protein PAPYR_3952 [Paratrimastix pyriformis]|uniref:EGF-like domain-containing protein n=1 Tax=Paratrimastix pyriformis TaxID=342808 RepID=A0ABQ8UL10_9EUKA|nr:hypothetical protein PAPYR_3952 [Paratrimastix pyriformis]